MQNFIKDHDDDDDDDVNNKGDAPTIFLSFYWIHLLLYITYWL